MRARAAPQLLGINRHRLSAARPRRCAASGPQGRSASPHGNIGAVAGL